MRRHYYRQQYQVPKESKPPKKRRSHPLVQPNWDDTIHDLSHLRLSPEAQLRRHLSRISKNQLGVAVLSSRQALQSGGGSSRYTPSTGSADAASLSSSSDNDDDDHGGEFAHASDPGEDLPLRQQQRQGSRRQLRWGAPCSAAPAAAGSDEEDDLCRWQGGLNSPLQQQQQQQEQGLGALCDISNSNRIAQGPRHSHQLPKQQHEAAGTSRGEAGAAGGAVHVEQDGRLLVEAQVLQLLLDKIDMLEHQPRQQQQPAGGQGSSNDGQQQHHVEQQLRQQLALTQQQLARLQEDHTRYVDRTSHLLVRLQAQMQQLMAQAPGLAAGAGVAEQLQDFAAGHQLLKQPQPAGAWDVPASSSSSPQRSAATAAAAVPGLRSSAAGRSPVRAHLRPATAVSVTALQHRPGSACGSSSTAASPARASAAGAAAASSSRLGSAAVQVAEAAALPSYAEMRQRRSAAGTGALWAGGTCFTAAPSVTAAPAAAAAAANADEQDAYLSSMLGASNRTDSQLPFSRAVPAPIGAPNPAATAAAALSGSAASLQEQRRPGSWSNADQVAPVIAAHSSAGPEAGLLLSQGLAAEAYGALPGLQDVGWGLAEGLPRSAVSRVFTAAGVAEAAELLPRPQVLLGQLAGNVSLMDHLRAAKAAAAAQASGAGDTAGMRV
ncbi:hypothetical protein COO60DRAFT_212342 [Scenedesmus sp. NREL 46B-D3]|nr:hypothetical protein COO60DRAFT_212342 [Scenedesmus sp. NREL 46B-D3]